MRLQFQWDYESDVVVVGFGYAGALSAIAAHDAGADVLVLEKAPENFAGGNSRVSGGGMRVPINIHDAIKYYKAVCFGTVPDEDIVAMADAMTKVPEILRGLGIEIAELGLPRMRHPVAGGESFRLYSIAKNGKPLFEPIAAVGSGDLLYGALKQRVIDRGIKVWYETPAKKLVQNPLTKEILGVVAERKDKTIGVKARKAVVLACGGYENNYEMWINFNFPGIKVYPWGSPYNTGDGIKMALDVGATLWHMVSIEWDCPCIKIPSEIYGCAVQTRVVGAMRPKVGSYIVVNKHGKRFMNECKSLVHRKEPLELTHFDQERLEYPNIPFYLIFDEAFRLQGPLVKNTRIGWHNIFSLYEWSYDNSAEIDKGWIVKADTPRELAKKLNINPEELEKTIISYNKNCEAKMDPDFHRPAETMIPLNSPPFYGVELALTITNTQGGPKRNAKAQVLDTENKPIPRLYAAGELGSFWGFVYPGGSNIAEAIALGYIAGKNAATERPWNKASMHSMKG
jgi:succinate dehydrogenase/fumarate reductase flavoprotein subunit